MAAIENNKAFSIENHLIPGTTNPFGEKYHGLFQVRRPSLGDKANIDLKEAAALSVYGKVDRSMLPEGMKLLIYIITYVNQIATAPLPEWFDLNKLYEGDDEDAVFAVWEEVTAFLDTFRPRAAGREGGDGEGMPAPVVSEKVQPPAD